MFDYRNKLLHGDAIEIMKEMPDNIFDFTITDIPYGEVNRPSNGLRNLDKTSADIVTFDMIEMLQLIQKVTKGSILIFCGRGQFSSIYNYFESQKGTVRPIIWEKTNPSPMNGKHIYLSGVEFAVWFKPRGWKTFNPCCKNTVFRFPSGRSKLHPTEKNHALIKELILDNSNKGDLIFDPFMGSGSHLLVAKELNRDYFGIELKKEWFDIAQQRLEVYDD